MKKTLFYLFSFLFTFLLVGAISIVAASDYDPVPVEADTLAETIDIGPEEYLSGIKEAEIDIWMVGAKIRTDQYEHDIELDVRTTSNLIDWTDWQHIHFNENHSEQQYIYADPIAMTEPGNYIQYKLTGETDEIVSVELVMLDPTEKEKTWIDYLGGFVQEALGLEPINIITRQQWGADESIMFWYDDAEFEDIDKIVIHHTAADDATPIDPPAVVRGIYYFHTVTRGWGDIGYNYLVDQHGNIYEGRQGGLGVVAAHALGSNYGSVGISVLGNFMNSYPAQDTLDALTNLISYVSQQTGVSLNSKTVVGHRDVDATACPGDHLYADIPEIILESVTPANPNDYQAMLLEISQEELFLGPDEYANVKISYLNTGNTAWLQTDHEVYLVPNKPYPRSSEFYNSSWVSSNKVTGPDHDTVMSNTAGNFILSLKAPSEYDFYVENFALYGPDGLIPGTDVSIKITVADQPVITDDNSTKNPKGIGAHNYHYNVKNISSNIHIVKGNTATLWFELENTGINNWFNHGLFPFRIGTWDPIDHDSQFYNDTDWLAPNRLDLPATKVAPGESVRFEVKVESDQLEPGTYYENFKGVIDGLTWLEDDPFGVRIIVSDPSYEAIVQNQNYNLTLKPGQTAFAWMDVTNLGNSPWDTDGVYPMKIYTNGGSSFYDYNYWNSDSEPDVGDLFVAPGLTTRLFILLTAPNSTGNYTECFNMKLDGLHDFGQLGCWNVNVSN